MLRFFFNWDLLLRCALFSDSGYLPCITWIGVMRS
ncbi:hypothetical protein SLEP1_g57523 [Rubroshorea leprosula]|uniref:Uncharacterized protein n=1 Tax=Rubroshorea leprosula TaxID=152421 RepID=A0AAV5MLY3_9ROSI|nr:hypothetical protein SLEP1_g57523 [Rubroshorea leprosula]